MFYFIVLYKVKCNKDEDEVLSKKNIRRVNGKKKE